MGFAMSMVLVIITIVGTFCILKVAEKTIHKSFIGICCVLTLTMVIGCNIVPVIICVDALHKQMDEVILCGKSHVIVIIIAHMHD